MKHRLSRRMGTVARSKNEGRVSLNLLLVLCLSIFTTAMAQVEGRRKILTLGGNGMIGSATLTRIIATGEYDITLASRGSWPFNTSDTVAPHVNHVECDRESENIQESCPELWQDIQSTEQYHAVIDFSGFEPEWVRNTIEILGEKVRVYIYVSSDSVYEVSEGKPFVETGTKSVETDAVRPSDKTLQMQLNQKDEYGHAKLACEEMLVEQKLKGGFPFVFLRFADVFGKGDDTNRLLFYYLWIKYQDVPGVPQVHLPESTPEATSITGLNDAVESILAVMDQPDTWNEAYNIACQELFDVNSAITMIGKLMGKEHVQAMFLPDDESFNMLPSVIRGPVDISKAGNSFKFQPTKLDTVLKETIGWYDAELQSNLKFLDESLVEWAIELFESEDEMDHVLLQIFEKIDGLVYHYGEEMDEF
eukprot:scaffold89936_cov59-Attheya_sp.AAC.2